MKSEKYVKVIPLGGLGEIGKNITAFEYEDEIVVVDCGIAFPDDDMYGVDMIIPDISYLLKNQDKIKGIFITHGHEDHIGAIPYILKQINVPLYATKLTLGIIENKLKEHNLLSSCTLNPVNASDFVNLKHFKMEFIRVTHSIADSCSIAIHTPVGIILHTGDFKIDHTPIDSLTMDLKRIAELGNEGILLLMADSTNVERKGHTLSEKSIGETLIRILSDAKGRVIVATFASNIHRMQQIINASLRYNRKVAFSGRSMLNISQVSRELGYLHIPDEYIIDVDEIDNYKDENITIITTGSQGEPMAALTRIAFSNHRQIKTKPNDLFIISASPIPGNDKLIAKVINELYKKNVDVIYKDLEDIHVSGHAFQEELKIMHSLTTPKYFMPVHGEYRHLKHHADLANKLGMNRNNIFILETGDVLKLSKDKAEKGDKVRAGSVFVDGLGVGDVGTIVLRDRRNLAQDGMINIVVTIEKETNSIIAGPDILTRGFVYVKESEELINSVKKIAKQELDRCLENSITEWYALKTNMKKTIERYLYEKTKRRPYVIPIIMEI